jgi:hypothetical protein
MRGSSPTRRPSPTRHSSLMRHPFPTRTHRRLLPPASSVASTSYPDVHLPDVVPSPTRRPSLTHISSPTLRPRRPPALLHECRRCRRP